jgi:hypothetical protein
MKKVFSLVVVSMFSLSILFTACGGGGEQAPEAPAEDTTAVEQAPAPVADTTAAPAADTTAAAAPAAQ